MALSIVIIQRIKSTSEFGRGTAWICYNDSVLLIMCKLFQERIFNSHSICYKHSLGSGKEYFLMALTWIMVINDLPNTRLEISAKSIIWYTIWWCIVAQMVLYLFAMVSTVGMMLTEDLNTSTRLNLKCMYATLRINYYGNTQVTRWMEATCSFSFKCMF